MDFSSISLDVVIEDILATADLTPLQLSGLKDLSPELHRRYTDALRSWILDRDSWITAIIYNNRCLYSDLQKLMESGVIVINEYIDYDSDTGEMERDEHYLRTYRDIREIGLTINDIISAMTDNSSYSTFAEAMTNWSFQSAITSAYGKDNSIIESLICLAIPHRETLVTLLYLFSNEHNAILSIIEGSLYMYGYDGIYDVLDVMKELRIRISRDTIDHILRDINDNLYNVDPVSTSLILEEYSNII